MATVEPVSLRFVRPELTGEVPSPPHDALSATARRQHLIDHPLSYLGVTRSPDDSGSQTADPAGDALRAGRTQLEWLLNQEVFNPATEPGFFVYRLELDQHQQTGLVGGVATTDYDDGTVRIHERINQSRADHLAAHLEVVGAQSSPIALAFKSRPEVVAIVENAVQATPPILDFVDESGLRQRLWAITDAGEIAQISSSFSNQPLYLIDGHHRAAAASTDRAGSADPTSRSHLMLAAIFPYQELRSQAFHRILTGVDGSQLAAELTDRFTTRTTDDPEVVARRAESELPFGYLGPDGHLRWLLLDVPLDLHARSDLDNIDPIRLGSQVLGPVLGIDESGSDRRLSYRPGLSDAATIAAVALASDEALFLMRPVPMDVLMDASDEGLVMPPKSTYFVPKVRSGLFIRIVDDSLA